MAYVTTFPQGIYMGVLYEKQVIGGGGAGASSPVVDLEIDDLLEKFFLKIPGVLIISYTKLM